MRKRGRATLATHSLETVADGSAPFLVSSDDCGGVGARPSRL